MNSEADPSPLDETHISSFVVQAKPEAVTDLTELIGAMDYVEVSMVSPDGKLIVYLETATSLQVTSNIDTITTLPGVLGCTLVSHHVEDTAGLDELVDTPPPETTETTV